MVRGLHDGETYAQMAARLNAALGKSNVGAIRIIRTECYRVFAEARKDRLDRIRGVDMFKEWITSKDERVRSSHVPMHGVKVAYNQDFILPNGASGFGPGMIGVAKEDINCRCFYAVDVMPKNGILGAGTESANDEEVEVFHSQKSLEILAKQKPMEDLETIARVKENLEKKGIYIVQDEEGDRYVESQGYEAVVLYQGDDELTIVMHTNISASGFYEELIHIGQIQSGRAIPYDKENEIEMEIEAKERLIKNKDAYKITDYEVEVLTAHLNSYKIQLDELRMGRG